MKNTVTPAMVLAARDSRLRRERREARLTRVLTARAIDTTATLNPILTTIMCQFLRDPSGFIGTRLLPPFATAEQSGNYYMFTPAELAQIANLTARAPGSAYQRVKRKLSNDSYACQDWGLEAPVPDEERKKYAVYFDADLSALNLIIDTIRCNYEQRVYNLVTGGSVPGAAISVPWNDSSSNPKGDVDAARETIRMGIGLMPNLLTITQPMLNVLSIHPKLVDLFKYTVAGVMDEDRLAAYFQIDKVAIARSVVATNNEGQSFTSADIWGNNAVVAHVNPAQDLKAPNFGRTFYWTAFTNQITTQNGGTGPNMTAGGGGGGDIAAVTSYRDETVESDIHRAKHFTAEKITGSTAGFILQNPIR
jgi:hypothetical protein